MGIYRYNLGMAFEAVVDVHRDKSALRFGADNELTYGDLNRLANRIARLLQGRGIRRGDVVALFNRKSSMGFAAMLAALKIGAAYTNLDEQNPVERLAKIVASCQPRAIIVDGEVEGALRDWIAGLGITSLDLGREDAVADFSDAPLERNIRITGRTPAYVMFTSGSTGVPKGVVIAHDSVLRFIEWGIDQLDVSPQDTLSNVNPLYFDNSVFDFYVALFSGATLAPIKRELLKQPQLLVQEIADRACTLWFSVPSMLIYLIVMRQLDANSWPTVRCLVFGGEGYPVGELQKLFSLFGHRARLVNVYGPTECTCICSAYTVTRQDLEGKTGLPPLGRMAPNFDFLLVDENGAEVPSGVAGELWLAGPQLALGYINDAQRSAAAFVENPLERRFRQFMYRTGDLVRQDDIGNLWFSGRRDNQIKHMGYRIELEEIEAALNSLPGINQSAAVYRRARAEHGEIIAFVAADAGLDEPELREALGCLLPAYMLPSRIEVMDDLPKNANGKVDRKALQSRLDG